MFEKISHFVEQFLAPIQGYEAIAYKVAIAIGFVVTGFLLGYLLRVASLFLMRKLGLSKLLDRFFEADINHRKYAVDKIVAKALSWFIFTLFIREAVKTLGFTEVESFLTDLIGYLPSLFLAVMIGFFGIRFSNTVYEMVYAGFKQYEDEQTAKVLAILGKGLVIAFTLMIMLNYVKIVDQFIINAIFVGFIAAMSLTFGLAFGLGGKEFARDLISRLKKRPVEPLPPEPKEQEKE